MTKELTQLRKLYEAVERCLAIPGARPRPYPKCKQGIMGMCAEHSCPINLAFCAIEPRGARRK